MLRVLTSILFASATISGACFAANQPEAPAEATKVQAVQAVQTVQTVQATQAEQPAQAQTAIVPQQAAAAPRTEIKLDEKPVPLFAADSKAVEPKTVVVPDAKEQSLEKKNDTKGNDIKGIETLPAAPVNKDQQAVVEPKENKNIAKEHTKKPNSIANEVKAKATEKATAKAKIEKTEAPLQGKNATETTTDVATDLRLVEFVLANQVVSREPKDIVEGFGEGSDRGFAFARINSKTTTEVTFLWTRNGHEFARVKAPIQAAKQWRTFSSVKLRSGEWKVQLLDQNKVVLAEKSFSIK